MRLTTIAFAAIAVYAQTPAFEVASVKPSLGGPPSVQSDPGRLTIRNQSVEVLIELAYGLREYQYEGPPWLHAARYDIVRRLLPPQPRPAQLSMLRGVLADRFNLAVHREVKTLPVCALVAAKTGARLKKMDDDQPAPFELYSNFHIESVAGGNAAGLRGYGSLGQLSDFLTRVAERPVVDRTGITGNFDFRLRCAIDGYPGFETSPSVFDALQTQLGLKLEATTAAVEITVVDRAEKPSGNY